ncbi:MAG: type II toxin-antitoxin system RelE/ParE family toxin [Bryobacterales bacterium]|nr:type II toxin-antitoxin system RelE/ParE family toxin [Bryobacterales bacterium]
MRTPAREIAEEFEISVDSVRRWVKQAQLDKCPPKRRHFIRRALTLLSEASGPGDLAGFGRLHPLPGDRSGHWALQVSANWRIVFRFDGGQVRDVDMVDYH